MDILTSIHWISVSNMPPKNRYVLISPCRNEAAYMRQTIDSVIGQSLKPTKWVIVDDGSSDATPSDAGRIRFKACLDPDSHACRSRASGRGARCH